MEIGADAGTHRPILDVIGERGAQTEIVEGSRSQLPDQVIDVLIELLSDFLERADLRRQSRVASATVFQGADAESERGQLLTELIVHLTRDAAALILLCEDEKREQLGSRALGALAFLHLLS